MIFAAVLVAILLLVVVYEFMPSSSTIASTSTAPATGSGSVGSVTKTPRSPGRHSSAAPAKKERVPPSLDPTLHLAQLASTEQIKYEGSGRNIFVSQPDPVIPTPVAPGTTGQNDPKLFQIPPVAAAPANPENPRRFSSPRGMMFSSRVRARSSTAATR